MKTGRFSTPAWFPMVVATVVFLIPSVFCRVPTRAVAAAPSVKVPRRVVAIYFHRTNRCPTCKRISAYIEESIKVGFAKQIKDGQISVHMIDFQNPKNRAYTKAYKISQPTLVLADVRDNKVTEWKPMPKVWSLVAKREAFFKYVQDGIRKYLEET